MEQLKAPNCQDFDEENLPLVWKTWKDEYELYNDLVMEGKEEKVKVKMLNVPARCQRKRNM